MAQSRGSVPSGTAGGQFSAVDRGAQEQRAFLLRALDYQNTAPALHEGKRQIREALALVAGLTVLEVGCGTGDDARAMAEQVGPSGHVTGIDVSAFMIEEAQRRATGAALLPITFAVADAEHLDFADNSFDRCRCERVLQHVADPAQAISEMVRVTKPGGRVVVADADWTAIVASDPITQVVFECNGRSLRSPRIGRDLGQIFRTSRLRQISVRVCPFIIASEEFTDQFAQMVQPSLVAAARAAGALSEADAAAWPETIVRDGRDGIGFLAVPYFVAVGTKA